MSDEALQALAANIGELTRSVNKFSNNLRPVLESIEQRLTLIEEQQAVTAGDTVQLREGLHKIRNILTPIAACVDISLDVAQGKSRSSDTIQAVRDRLHHEIANVTAD
jgi:ABC-type transporter Mla subunit MlaD